MSAMDFELIKAQNTLEFESAMLSMRVGDRIVVKEIDANMLRVPTGWVMTLWGKSDFSSDDTPYLLPGDEPSQMTSVFIPFPDQTIAGAKACYY